MMAADRAAPQVWQLIGCTTTEAARGAPWWVGSRGFCAVVVAAKGCAAVWGSRWSCTTGVAADELHRGRDGWQLRDLLHWWQPMLRCKAADGMRPDGVAAEGCAALEASGAALVAAEELHCTGGS